MKIILIAVELIIILRFINFLAWTFKKDTKTAFAGGILMLLSMGGAMGYLISRI